MTPDNPADDAPEHRRSPQPQPPERGPWASPEQDGPPTAPRAAPRTPTGQELNGFVADAVTAPSLHNSQPWSFRADRDGGRLQVRADRTRALPHVDPQGRGLHLAGGAALFNLRVAAARAGLEPSVTLLPDPDDPDLLAEVDFRTAPEPADADSARDDAEPAAYSERGELADLHGALRRRHSSREPFDPEPVDAALRDGLRRAALLEGARLVFPDPGHNEMVLALSREAELREEADPGRRADLEHWLGDGRPADSGLPREALGPRLRSGGAPVRDFEGPNAPADRPGAAFETDPQLALLGTTGDEPGDWLRAGQALERVLLQATQDGIATSVASSALEWDALRWAVRDPETDSGPVQMVIRLGYGPAGLPTERRPVSDVLTVDG
ncbi:putative NAD(P)H nitroreductase acg [Streptomyces sp. YIM 130001]|uniref:Acg family FMN-binding oxidoreductase n=1 Tax=Streptomyces sp. YIM 130001 TaxID=2259644 RepID=UPI000EEE66F2|nr:nitroreductase [Streptomyces sp. YIM 130001]RII14726.1 putative NAD(P)H nitroreductase acg [Streptomyces sp. YIM 130001]